MDLLERYLQAVKFWLPKGQQDDILAELSEDIRSQVEETESGLGRKLTDEEMGALLKKRGRPMLVAMRFRPQRYLIGPGLFPMYWFVLRIAVLCYLVPWAIAGVVLLVFGISHRPPGEIIGSFWGSLWGTLALQFSIITVVFAGIEHFGNRAGFAQNWNPATLPAVRPARDPFRVSRVGAAAELVFGVIFIAWWIVMPQGFPFSWGLEKAGIHWNWGPVWMDFHGHFFFHVIFLSVLGLGVNAANVVSPRWTRPRLAIRAGINAAMSLMAYFVVRAHLPEVKAELALFSSPHAPVGDSENVTTIINLCIYLALAITVVAAGIQSLVELTRMARLSNARASRNASVVALTALMIAGGASLGAVKKGMDQNQPSGISTLPRHIGSTWSFKESYERASEAAECLATGANRLI